MQLLQLESVSPTFVLHMSLVRTKSCRAFQRKSQVRTQISALSWLQDLFQKPLAEAPLLSPAPCCAIESKADKAQTPATSSSCHRSQSPESSPHAGHISTSTVSPLRMHQKDCLIKAGLRGQSCMYRADQLSLGMVS